MQFVNRHRELRFLEAELSKDYVASNGLILSSPSGVGKSTLVDEAARRIPGVPVIRVKIKETEIDSLSDHQYVQQIFRSMAKFARDDHKKHTFEEFLNSTKAKSFLNACLEALEKLAAEQHWAGRLLNHVRDSMKDGNADIDTISKNNLPATIRLCIEYIKFSIEQQEPVIVIENSQDIDAASIDHISQLIEFGPAAYWIFEYTEKPCSKWTIDALRSGLHSPNQRLKTLNLKPISAKDVVKLITKYPDRAQQIITRLYEESDGNLRPFVDIDFVIDLSKDFDDEIFDFDTFNEFTQGNLLSLSNAEKFVISVLVQNGGEASIDFIVHCKTISREPKGYWSIDQCLQELQDRCLIEQDNHWVSISQDRLTSTIRKSTEFERFLLIAAKALIAVYEDVDLALLTSFISPIQKVMMLLRLNTEIGNRESAIKYLQDIKNLIATSLSVRSVGPYIVKAFDHYNEIHKLKESLSEDLSHIESGMCQLLEILLLSGAFEEAVKCADDLETDNRRLITLSAMIYDIYGRHSEAYKIASNMLNDLDKSCIDQELVLKLIMISALRNLNNFEKAHSLFFDCIISQQYNQCKAFGYLLRVSEIVLPPSEAVDLMLEAANLFQKQALKLPEARARVAATLCLADLGRLDTADFQLDLAEELLKNQFSELHTLLNNRAAIKLYRKISGAEITSLLDDAMAQCFGIFERLIILNNYIVNMALSEEFGDFEPVVRDILKILDGDKPNDLEIRRLTYWNLYMACATAGFRQSANKYLDYCKKIRCELHNEFWKARFAGAACKNIDYAFRSEHRFSPIMMSYWTIDIDIFEL